MYTEVKIVGAANLYENKIFVDSNLPPEHRIRIIFHEVGHIFSTYPPSVTNNFLSFEEVRERVISLDGLEDFIPDGLLLDILLFQKEDDEFERFYPLIDLIIRTFTSGEFSITDIEISPLTQEIQEDTMATFENYTPTLALKFEFPPYYIQLCCHTLLKNLVFSRLSKYDLSQYGIRDGLNLKILCESRLNFFVPNIPKYEKLASIIDRITERKTGKISLSLESYRWPKEETL